MMTKRISLLFSLAFALAPTTARAEQLGAEADVSTSNPPASNERTDDDSSAFLAAGKIGAIVPFNGLHPFVAGGVEFGWIFSGTNRRIGALLDVEYTAPSGDGNESDARVASGNYSWEIRQKELVFQPTFLYRFTSGGPLVPFAGLGPRIYFLETTGKGEAGGNALQETHEKSTKFGLGLPLGIEYQLGPGALFLEAQLEWGPLDHRITGDTSLAAVTPLIGYRALL
jgi:Outer membrane protein beta-barrel domain